MRITIDLKVEDNIAKIDEHYVISGAICLVNCIGVSNVIGMIHKSRELCQKYNIRFLSANVFVSLCLKIILVFGCTLVYIFKTYCYYYRMCEVVSI